MFDIFTENPERAARFGQYFSNPNQTLDFLAESYPWAEVKTMVDVGGSHGGVAIGLAEQFPHLKCYVQDLPDTVAQGASNLAGHLQDRVIFQAQYVRRDK